MSNQQTVIMVPAKAVRQDLKTETNTIVYMPLATTENPGVVKIGNGLNIDADGVVSFNQDEITILNIAKNGVIIPPDENKIVDIILNKTDVGLGNVDNTSDLNKPVSVYQQDALNLKLNKNLGTSNNGKLLYVDSNGNIDVRDVDKLDVYSDEGLLSNVVEQFKFSDAFEVDVENLTAIDVYGRDSINIDLKPKYKNSINNVLYNPSTGVLTFVKADGNNINVDLPLELLIKSGRFDEQMGDIVLDLANGQEIRIPVKELINYYYADNDTLELVAIDGKLTFRLKNDGISTKHLMNDSVTNDKIVSVNGSKVIGTVSSALMAYTDESGEYISSKYQQIKNSYNKTEIDELLSDKIDYSQLPVVIRMGGVQ